MNARAPAIWWRDSAEGLVEELRRARAGDPLAPATIVAPTTYAAVSARRAMVLAARHRGVGATANITCTTLGRLARRLGCSTLARKGLRPVPAPVEVETVRQVAGGQERWAPLVAHSRTLVALLEAFSELRRLNPTALEALSRRPSRGSEVAALLVEVRRRLHDVGFADELDVGYAALEALEQGGLGAWRTGAIVLLEPPPPSPLDAALVSALSRRVRCATVEPPPHPRATERWRCTDPEEEVRTAVRVVVAGAEDGVALWHQALWYPGGRQYAELLHQQLAASGIPANMPERYRLDRTCPGRALLGLLDLAGGEWQRDQVLGWLTSAPLRTGPGGRPVPVSRWNALSAAAGVVRGLTQWHERLTRFAAREPAEADEAHALAEFVEELAERTGRQARSWAERARWAAGLLERYLDPTEGSPWPPEQQLAMGQVAAVVRSLADLDLVAGPPDLHAFRGAVRSELERHGLDATGLEGHGMGHGVFVAPFALARGMHFHTAVALGLAESVVPGGAGDDALLPDELRSLDSSGALRTRAGRHERLVADASAAVGAGATRRVVTFPSVDPRTGRPELPSRLLDSLAAGASIRQVESLTASLRGGGPVLTVSEHRLRVLLSWADSGGDVEQSPPARIDARLRTGFEAWRARAGRAFTRFDGFVGAGRVTPFDPEQPVSATRLETYAECPRKFLFQRVLQVSERTLPEDLWRIEARHRGSLVHAVLEQYVQERIGGSPRSLPRLLAIAEEHLEEASAGGLVGKPLLWRLDRAAISRDLHMVHAEEGDLTPLAAELAFGDPDDSAPAVSVALADGRRVCFRGRADRVDRGRHGELVVSDYKTGRQSGISRLGDDPLDGGRRLQLPLYALAARRVFGAAGPVLARYWMVSAERSAASLELELTEGLERHFAGVVARIARGIDEGCFPAVPGAPRAHGFEGCAWCDFDRVCPARRDRQWSAKRAAPELVPVDDLLACRVAEPLPATLVPSHGGALSEGGG